MTTYVYRLHVTRPDGSDSPGWEPPGWVPDVDEDGSLRPFRWPHRRHYLSKSGAYTAKRILEGYGASVAVETSEPVLFAPDPDDPCDALRVKRGAA